MAISIIKLDPLFAFHIDGSAAVATALLLVLLLRKPFAFRDDEIFVRPIRVVVRNVSI